MVLREKQLGVLDRVTLERREVERTLRRVPETLGRHVVYVLSIRYTMTALSAVTTITFYAIATPLFHLP